MKKQNSLLAWKTTWKLKRVANPCQKIQFLTHYPIVLTVFRVSINMTNSHVVSVGKIVLSAQMLIIVNPVAKDSNWAKFKKGNRDIVYKYVEMEQNSVYNVMMGIKIMETGVRLNAKKNKDGNVLAVLLRQQTNAKKFK